MPAVPAGRARLIPLGAILLVKRPTDRRILVVRSERLAAIVTVRSERAPAFWKEFGGPIMTNTSGQDWQMRWPAGMAMWLVLSSSAVALASDFESVGEEARAGVTVESPFVQGASSALEMEAV
jgi:hypothetical protein